MTRPCQGAGKGRLQAMRGTNRIIRSRNRAKPCRPGQFGSLRAFKRTEANVRESCKRGAFDTFGLSARNLLRSLDPCRGVAAPCPQPAKDTAFIYLVDGETQQVHLTYEELDRKARAIAAWLESLDLGANGRCCSIRPGWISSPAFFGCLYAGVVAVPVYPPRRNRSLARIQAIADDAQAKVALTTDTVLERIEPLIDETPHLKELTWLDTCHVRRGHGPATGRCPTSTATRWPSCNTRRARRARPRAWCSTMPT